MEEVAWAAEVMRSPGEAINQDRKACVCHVSTAQTEWNPRFLAAGRPYMEHTYIVYHASREPIRTITGKGPVGLAPYAPLVAQ